MSEAAADTLRELAQDDADAFFSGIARSSLSVLFLLCIPAALLSSPWIARPILDDAGQRVRWLAVVAVAATSLATAACATHWRVRPARLLAVTFAVLSVYMLSVVAQYVPERRLWSAAQIATWPAIPLVYVLWTRTALNMAWHLRPDPTIRGALSGIHGLRRWSRWPWPLRWRSVPTPELFVSWIPGLVFCVLGVVWHSWFYGRVPQPAPERWRSWSYKPRWPYDILGIWGLVLVLSATVVLIGAWRVRRGRLPPGVLERGRWATYASATFVVLDAMILWGTTRAETVEPVIDLLIAAGVLSIALLTMNAEQYKTALAAYSSLGRRSLACGVWLVVVVLAAAGYAGNVLGQAIFAGALAALYPLAPIGLRAMTGISVASGGDSRPPREAPTGPSFPTADETRSPTERLRFCLACDHSKFRVIGTDPDAIDRARIQLEKLTSVEFTQLLGELPGGRNSVWNLGRPSDKWRLTAFIDQFPALNGRSHEERAQSFVRLVYETACHSPGRGHDIDEGAPSNWRWLRAYCLERTPRPEDPDEDADYDTELRRIHLYLRGNQTSVMRHDGRLGPLYSLAEILDMNDDELIHALNLASGSGMNRTRLRQRERAVKETAPAVFAIWLRAVGSSSEFARIHVD
jgi:hypothetical protein